jgi:hypothetical protein
VVWLAVVLVLVLVGACVGLWRASGRLPTDARSRRDGGSTYLSESDLAQVRQEGGRRFPGRR